MKTKAVLVDKTLKILNAAGEELSFAKDGVDFEATQALYGAPDSPKFTAHQISGIVITEDKSWIEGPETRIDTAETFLRMVAAHLGYAVVKQEVLVDEIAHHHVQRAHGGNMPKAIEANRRIWVEEYLRRYPDFDMDDAQQEFVNANMKLWKECFR